MTSKLGEMLTLTGQQIEDIEKFVEEDNKFGQVIEFCRSFETIDMLLILKCNSSFFLMSFQFACECLVKIMGVVSNLFQHSLVYIAKLMRLF